jgi:hypothetical protein
MKCRLCLSEVTSLKKSHIIPECLYEKVYDNKHRFIPISNQNYQDLKVEQLGYREELLCDCCEKKLSKWENYTKKDLVNISKRSSNFLEISNLSKKLVLVKNINHNSFKMCMLSILWRMSVSSHEMFGRYNLGPFEEKIRLVIDQGVSLTTFDYPLLVKEVTLKGAHYPDLITCIGKGRIGHLIFQSFIVYGYLIDIVVSSQKVENRYEPLLLSDGNSLVVGKVEHQSLPHDSGLLDRFKQDDIAKFYQLS